MFKRNFFLASDRHVPKQVIDKFSEVSSSLLEMDGFNLWTLWWDSGSRFLGAWSVSKRDMSSILNRLVWTSFIILYSFIPVIWYASAWFSCSKLFGSEFKDVVVGCIVDANDNVATCITNAKKDGFVFMINASKPFEFRSLKTFSASKMLTLSLKSPVKCL